jgi:outer membrane protein assembly complex protein YaeT
VFHIPAHGQGGAGLQNSVRPILVNDILVKGIETIHADRVEAATGIVPGESYVPQLFQQKVRSAIQSIYDLGWFSNVELELEAASGVQGANIIVRVQEYPTLGSVSYKGNRALNTSKLEGVSYMLEGSSLSPSLLKREKEGILDLYRKEGYILATVEVLKQKDEETGRENVTFLIQEGDPIKVRYITFLGNDNISARNLRSALPIERKSWFFGTGGEFKEEQLRASKDSVAHYYRQKGYLDVAVQDAQAEYVRRNTEVDVHISVEEGWQYRMGDVRIVHNDILNERAIRAQVVLDSGDVANVDKLAMSKYQVETLFRDRGRLFVQVQEERSYRDSVVDITYFIKEGNIARINKVHIYGNTKTKDKVIRRELRVYPGDVFNQSLVLRSHRDVMQLNFFDAVLPNYEPVGEDQVNMVFEVQEKEAGTGTFSAGAAYSARDGLVGNLGLKIPNLFGNGQQLDLQLEFGRFKQLYSIGFTEPWFLDTPTLIGGSVFWQKIRNLAYIEEDPITGVINPNGSRNQIRYGFRIRLGRRLTWPDDYFSVSTSYNLTQNDNGRQRNPALLLQQSGLESSVGVNLVRDDKDLPVFPTEGSRFSVSYNHYGGLLGGDFDYSRVQTKLNWWFPILRTSKTRTLVLSVESEFGVIDGKNIQQFDLFQMGGLLGVNGKMRGYSDGAIGISRIGRSFFSLVAELVYPVAPNVFYLKAFYDLGNVFGDVKKVRLVDGQFDPVKSGELGSPIQDVDLSNLLRDYGAGFRLVIPAVGIMGLDFGWALDDPIQNGERVAPGGMKTNFVIEAPF